MKTSFTPIPFFSFLFFFLALTQFLHAQSSGGTEKILVEGSSGRVYLYPEGPDLELLVCGLEVGETYAFYANAESGPDQWGLSLAALPGEKGEGSQPLSFIASQACTQLHLSCKKSNAPAATPVVFSYARYGSLSGEKGSSKLLTPILTDSSVPVNTLIQEVFLGGNCFEVFNVSSSVNPEASGTFINGLTSIGFDQGFLLATGPISLATGPNNSPNEGEDLFSTGFDPDLAAISTNSIHDVAVIEFDFIPTVDTVRFEYVFASEEYCEFVSTNFNDVFGFFISGPGISGPFSNGAINIAQVPGTSTPVAVNNVNHQQNSAYYVGNIPAGSSQLINPNCNGHPISSGPPVEDCQYDGFTTALTAEAVVIPCSTYHIKLAIADVADGIYDAAVFFKANSFNPGAEVTVEAVGNVDTTNIVYEGCDPGFFKFTRVDGDTTEALVVAFSILTTSTAVADTDYVALPDTIIIPPGAFDFWLPVAAIPDTLLEGAETILLELENPCDCEDPVIEMIVQDPPVIEIELLDQSICSGQSAGLEAAPSQGLFPYSFSWSTGDTTAQIQVTPDQDSSVYFVTVTDACGNTASDSAWVFLEQGPTATLSGNGSICGLDSVALTVHFTGAGPWEFIYAFNGVAQPPISSADTAYTWLVSEVGVYELLSVADLSDCPGVVSGTVEVSEGALFLELDVADVSCNGAADGAITALASGGLGVYTYAWSNNETGQTISGLAPGLYAVTVTDTTGCIAIDTALVMEPAALVVSFEADAIDCFGDDSGSVQAFISGGTAPYLYSWNTGDTTALLQSLLAGTYFLTATDALGCTIQDSVVLTEELPLLANLSVFPVSCAGGLDGYAFVEPEGGVPPYVIQWSNFTAQDSLLGLSAGAYGVKVRDALGCTVLESFEITEPAALETLITIEAVPCAGDSTGAIALTASGGIAPYSILWNTGATDFTLTGLPGGLYAYTLTDSNACTLAGIVDLQENETPVLTVESLANTCFGGTTGMAQVSISGGEPPYVVSWDTGSDQEVVGALAAGLYGVTATDANGCIGSGSVTIESDPAEGCLAYVLQEISTYNGADGSVGIDPPAGFTPPYGYLWDTGDTTSVLTGLAAGLYAATLTDANGCLSFCSVILENPSQVGDFVWEDLDEDGQQDAGEPGLEGILVTLSGVDLEGNPVQEVVTTDAQGTYLFDGLRAGEYELVFSNLPLDYIFSPYQAGNPSTDSDVLDDSGKTAGFTLAFDESLLSLDAGLYNNCDNLTDPGVISGDEYLCGPGNDPGPIVEIAPPSGGSGAIEYLWMQSTGDGVWEPIPGTNSPSYDPGPIYQTTYFVRCTRRENCTLFLETNIVVKEVGNDAVAQIEGPASACINEPEWYHAADAGQGAVYSWDFGWGANPPTASTQEVEVFWSMAGFRTVQLTVTRNGCTSTDALQIFVTNAPNVCGNNIQENAGDPGKVAAIFPNPAGDWVTVQWIEQPEGSVFMDISGMDGRLVLSRELGSDPRQQVDLSALQPGVYVVAIKTNGQNAAVFRLVKQ